MPAPPASPTSASAPGFPAPGSPVVLHAAPENKLCPGAPRRPPYTPHIPLGVGRVLVFTDNDLSVDDDDLPVDDDDLPVDDDDLPVVVGYAEDSQIIG